MKDILETTPERLADEQDNFANRKLIRPALPRVDHNNGHSANHSSNHNSLHLQVADRSDRKDKDRDRPERAHERGRDHGLQNHSPQNHGSQNHGQERGERPGAGGKKSAPPEQTYAENFYYQKQMQSRTPMVVVLQDGEEVHGIIEWYDKMCIKVIRADSGPNLMIYKPAIKYMFKAEERGR